MPRTIKTKEEKKSVKRMYNEAYYQNNKDKFRQYYQDNKDKLGYGRFVSPQVGIYVLKNKTTNYVYVGASKNIVGRWRVHKVSTLKNWTNIAPVEELYYEVVCELPSYLDCQAMNHFEWLLIVSLKNEGVPLLNTYNSRLEQEQHTNAIETMLGTLSESARQWVESKLRSLPRPQ